jgi:hypothetical protein
MSDNCNLYSFPSNTLEALSMLYMQNQDLKGKSVKEITEIYYDTYYEIRSISTEIKKNSYNKFFNQ